VSLRFLQLISLHRVFLIKISFECDLLQRGASIALESPDQKTQVFLVQIDLTPRSLVHAHNLFDEMHVRICATF
jgi:hypothetical protein